MCGGDTCRGLGEGKSVLLWSRLTAASESYKESSFWPTSSKVFVPFYGEHSWERPGLTDCICRKELVRRPRVSTLPALFTVSNLNLNEQL